MENKFKKGLILGGLLAVGAAVGFAMSKQGQELSEDLKKDFDSLMKHLKKSLHKLEDITKESFDELVVTVVDEYSEKKEMAVEAKEALTKALKVTWSEMEKMYTGEAEEAHKKD